MNAIKDYFNIEYGQREYHSKRHLVDKPGDIPLISSKGTNQGIYGHFDIKPKYKHVISVPSTGTICYAFYQGENCCIDDNCLVLTPKKELTLNEMFYFVSLIRKEKYKYMYGRQVTPEKLGNTKIPEIPKWVYEDIKENFEKIKSPISKSKLNLLEKKWKYFIYEELFDVKKGKRLVMSQMNQNGKYPFVSSIDNNNGVSCKVDVKPNQEGNTITVNYDGSVAEAFYQPDPFWALDSVNVLYPKFNLNSNIGMFLVTLIKKEKYRFNYGRKWHKERMEKSKIKLPVDKEGKPDWKFMNEFIKTMNYSKLLN